MKLILNSASYAHLLYMQEHELWAKSVNSVKYTRPLVEYEGMVGFVEIKTLEIEVLDLHLLSRVYYSFYSLPSIDRLDYEKRAKGVPCRVQ